MPFRIVSAPDGLATAEFVLRPITVADTALDHEAVMASREYLRPWEQTGWPADDFTVEDDRADVQGLERRHLERRAFTYTVVTPDEARCLGCVYLLPPDARTFADARITAEDGGDFGALDALVYFWVRTDRLADGLDERLLAALQGWFDTDWRLGAWCVVTNEQVGQQVALLERAGMARRFTIAKPGQAGAYLAYSS